MIISSPTALRKLEQAAAVGYQPAGLRIVAHRMEEQHRAEVEAERQCQLQEEARQQAEKKRLAAEAKRREEEARQQTERERQEEETGRKEQERLRAEAEAAQQRLLQEQVRKQAERERLEVEANRKEQERQRAEIEAEKQCLMQEEARKQSQIDLMVAETLQAKKILSRTGRFRTPGFIAGFIIPLFALFALFDIEFSSNIIFWIMLSVLFGFLGVSIVLFCEPHIDDKIECDIGLIYHYGLHGVRINLKHAHNWYKKSILHGNLQAFIYLKSLPHPHNISPESEIKYLKISAEDQSKKDRIIKEQEALLRLARQPDNEEQAKLTLDKMIKLASRGELIGELCGGLCGFTMLIFAAIDHLQIRNSAGAGFGAFLLGRYLGGVTAKFLSQPKDPEMLMNIGNYYSLVKHDYCESILWYKKSEIHGNSEAQNNLGVLHEFGLGVKQDHKQARTWYELAAAQGNSLAKKNLQNLPR